MAADRIKKSYPHVQGSLAPSGRIGRRRAKSSKLKAISEREKRISMRIDGKELSDDTHSDDEQGG